MKKSKRAVAARSRSRTESSSPKGLPVRGPTQNPELVIAGLLVHVAATTAPDSEFGVQTGKVAHAQAGEEVQSLFVGPVHEHPQRIETAIDQALHVLPHAPVGGHRHLVQVGPEAETLL